MKKLIIVDIISSLFIILFLYTGIYKMLDLNHFKGALSKSPLLKNIFGEVAYTLPPLEILVALFLLIPFFVHQPRLRNWGLYSSSVMMTVFTLYIGYMLAFRSDRPCTCGGIISQMNWHQHLYFNTMFTFLAFLAIWLNNKQFKQNSQCTALA